MIVVDAAGRGDRRRRARTGPADVGGDAPPRASGEGDARQEKNAAVVSLIAQLILSTEG